MTAEKSRAGVVPSPAEKEWKQCSSRLERRAETVALARAGEDDPDLPAKRALTLMGSKNGKHRLIR